MKKIFLLILNSLIITCAFGQGSQIRYAPVASPHLTGTPLAPTPSTADNSTKIATTAYAQNLLTANAIFFESGLFGGSGTSGSPFTLISKANTWSGINIFQNNGLGTGNADELTVSNRTVSLSSGATTQNSPYFRIGGTGYGSTLPGSQNVDFLYDVVPISAAVPSGALNLYSQINGGTAQLVESWSTAGGTQYFNTVTNFFNFIGATSTDGFTLNNNAASSSGNTLQKSTRIRYAGSVWNSTATAAANYFGFTTEASGVTGLIPTGEYDTYGYVGVSSTPTFVKLTALDAASGNLTLVTGNLITKGTAVAINSTATATAAQIAGGMITSTSASATTITLPTASALATQLGITGLGHFEFSVYNTGGANTVTIATGSGMTQLSILTGENTLTVASGATGLGRFALDFSSTSSCTIARIQ